MLSCPISFGVGFCTIPCALNQRTQAYPNGGGCAGRDRKGLMSLFGALLLGGFVVLYLPLTILCARADGDRWKLYKGEGDCWSEGGEGTGISLGLFAGAIMGFSLAGLCVTLMCGPNQGAVVTGGEGEQETGEELQQQIV